jgi:hypothetical protein
VQVHYLTWNQAGDTSLDLWLELDPLHDIFDARDIIIIIKV